jgi:hypothetical protein
MTERTVKGWTLTMRPPHGGMWLHEPTGWLFELVEASPMFWEGWQRATGEVVVARTLAKCVAAAQTHAACNACRRAGVAHRRTLSA